jgi:hypothetical protein
MGYYNLTFYQNFLANAYLRILVGILLRVPKQSVSAQLAPDGPTSAMPRTANRVEEQPVFPSMSGDSHRATLVSSHES